MGFGPPHSFEFFGGVPEAVAPDNAKYRPFKRLEGSRKSLYETIERVALKPLPKEPYEFAEWKRARVNIGYHVEVDKNFYSVPYQLVHEEVDARLTGTTVELPYRGKRVASHQRSFSKGQFITDPAHRPSSHRRRLVRAASRAGLPLMSKSILEHGLERAAWRNPLWSRSSGPTSPGSPSKREPGFWPTANGHTGRTDASKDSFRKPSSGFHRAWKTSTTGSRGDLTKVSR